MDTMVMTLIGLLGVFASRESENSGENNEKTDKEARAGQSYQSEGQSESKPGLDPNLPSSSLSSTSKAGDAKSASNDSGIGSSSGEKLYSLIEILENAEKRALSNIVKENRQLDEQNLQLALEIESFCKQIAVYEDQTRECPSCNKVYSLKQEKLEPISEDEMKIVRLKDELRKVQERKERQRIAFQNLQMKATPQHSS